MIAANVNRINEVGRDGDLSFWQDGALHRLRAPTLGTGGRRASPSVSRPSSGRPDARPRSWARRSHTEPGDRLRRLAVFELSDHLRNNVNAHGGGLHPIPLLRLVGQSCLLPSVGRSARRPWCPSAYAHAGASEYYTYCCRTPALLLALARAPLLHHRIHGPAASPHHCRRRCRRHRPHLDPQVSAQTRARARTTGSARATQSHRSRRRCVWYRPRLQLAQPLPPSVPPSPLFPGGWFAESAPVPRRAACRRERLLLARYQRARVSVSYCLRISGVSLLAVALVRPAVLPLATPYHAALHLRSEDDTRLRRRPRSRRAPR